MRRTALLSCACALAVFAVACSDGGPAGDEAADALAARDVPSRLDVSSPAFADGAPVPVSYSCDGDDLAPPLEWSGVPAAARSLAIVVDDPDAPGGTFTHWIVTQIPADAGSTVEGQSPGVQLANSFGVEEYRGPCPPAADDAHAYRFTLYALDGDGVVCGGDTASTDQCAPPTTAEALEYVAAHAIANGTLTGTFDR